MNKKKIIIIPLLLIVLIGVLIGLIYQLGNNYIFFVKIWITLLISGIIFLPISLLLFKKNYNNAWIFSKLLGLVIPSLIVWNFSYLKILKYTTLNCFVVFLLMLIISSCIFWKKKQHRLFDKEKIISILVTEILFIIILMICTVFKSFDVLITPNTEQYMNYGFINKLMNTTYLPVEDIWLSGNSLNYYYFGQYFISFIGKIMFSEIKELYSMGCVIVSSFTFIMPFSIGYSMAKKIKAKNKKQSITISIIVALLVGLSIFIGGTLHFPIYKYFVHNNENQYRYSDAVRYLSDDIETVATDIPSYSNLVGDLHAHYIDTMFSFTTLAILIEVLIYSDKNKVDKEKTKNTDLNYKRIFNIHILFLGIMLGIQKMTNYWAFPIYTVVILIVLIANYFTKYKINKETVLETCFQIVEVFLIQAIVSFTFSNVLYISASEVQLTHKTSQIYKLMVLWGLPIICVTFMMIYQILLYIKNMKNKKFYDYIKEVNKADILALIFGLCAIGLILIPEIIFVKDIYEDNYKRFNTVFKLSYEAYILFSISANYIIIKFLTQKGNKIKKIFTIFLLILQISTLGYGIDGIIYIKTDKTYKLNDAELYLKETNPEDYKAIQWIKENIDKESVILQSLGISYETSSQISVFTGNPTLLGWEGHEWVWRANKKYMPCQEHMERRQIVKDIYTIYDVEQIKEAVNKYNISYIYIGEEENKKYCEGLNLNNLINSGEIVYQNENVYLIKTK